MMNIFMNGNRKLNVKSSGMIILACFCLLGIVMVLKNTPHSSLKGSFVTRNQASLLPGLVNTGGSPSRKGSGIKRISGPHAEAHVFYHIMLTATMEKTWSVVNEQLEYLRVSGMEDMVQNIHYTAIGPSYDTFELEPEDEKYEKTNVSNHHGWEKDTLRVLQQHCQRRPQDVVLYIHTKGVYHESKANEIQRQDQTRSLTDIACLQSMREKGETSGIWGSFAGTGNDSNDG